MIVTVQTSKHRIFQFLEMEFMPDQKLMVFGFASAEVLGMLSSSAHCYWSQATCGWLGVGNDSVYVKSKSFDAFPFPDASPAQRRAIGDLAEELDATRKDVLARHGDLTLTGLYNLREAVRSGKPLDPVAQDQRRRGLVDVIDELHNAIDRAVADAYGWPHDLAAEAIVTRLVALNAARHAEERAGTVRWLRPDYQLPRAGIAQLPGAAQPETGQPEQIEALLPVAKTARPLFPRDAIGQTAAVIADLRHGGSACTAATIAARYSQGRKVERRIAATLEALERLGHVAREGEGFALRKVA